MDPSDLQDAGVNNRKYHVVTGFPMNRVVGLGFPPRVLMGLKALSFVYHRPFYYPAKSARPVNFTHQHGSGAGRSFVREKINNLAPEHQFLNLSSSIIVDNKVGPDRNQCCGMVSRIMATHPNPSYRPVMAIASCCCELPKGRAPSAFGARNPM